MLSHGQTIVQIPQTNFDDQQSDVSASWTGQLHVHGVGNVTTPDEYEMDENFLGSFWISGTSGFHLRLLVCINGPIEGIDTFKLLSDTTSWLHDH